VRENTCIHHFALGSFTEAQLRMVQIKAYLCVKFEYRSVSTVGWEAVSLFLSSGLLHCIVCLNMEARDESETLMTTYMARRRHSLEKDDMNFHHGNGLHQRLVLRPDYVTEK